MLFEKLSGDGDVLVWLQDFGGKVPISEGRGMSSRAAHPASSGSFALRGLSDLIFAFTKALEVWEFLGEHFA